MNRGFRKIEINGAKKEENFTEGERNTQMERKKQSVVLQEKLRCEGS